MKTHLSGAHARTFKTIFRHPVARNLHWRDVRSMLEALADVVEESNGNLKVMRAGQTLVLRPTRDKMVATVEELLELRHFLRRSSSGEPLPEDVVAAAGGRDLLVVIDHRAARIYHAESSGTPAEVITPYDPHGYGRYLHYVEDESNGHRKPERKSFYESVARTLEDAGRIVLFGNGTGASSAMDQLMADLKRLHRRTADRVVACVAVDEQHLTENQMLARARAIFTKLDARAHPHAHAGAAR